MVKRQENLVPLSQEHHSHLVFSKRLREGKPSNIKSNWPENKEEQKLIEQTIKYFKVDMLAHFELEEKIVFPVYRSYLDDNDPKLELLNYIIDHHKIVKSKIEQIKFLKGSRLINQLKEIGIEIKNHISKEEKELFNDIQKTVPIDELIIIGRELKEKSSLTCSHFL